MKLSVLIILIEISILKKLDLEVKNTIISEGTKRFSNDEVKAILKYVENDKNNEYVKFLGRGSYGIVLKMKDENGKKWAVKFQFDNYKYSECNSLYKQYTDIVGSNEEDNVVIKMLSPVKEQYFYKDTRTGKSETIFLCAIQMELGSSSKTNILNETHRPSRANNLILLNFFLKIVRSFVRFNFGYLYYHGDIKLDNVIYKKDSNGEFEIRIIDFDLSFPRPKKICEKLGIDYYAEEYKSFPKGKINPILDCNPDFITYSLMYRAPELKAIVSDVNFSKDKSKRAIERDKYSRYIWNRQFKEEAYSVGVLLDDIREIHLDQLDRHDVSYQVIQEVITHLTRTNPRDRWDLIETKEFLKEEIANPRAKKEHKEERKERLKI